MSQVRHKFGKNQHLVSHKIISKIFNKEGKSIRSFPLTLIYLNHQLEVDYPIQIMISVSSRKISNAVDRNLLKRRIREIYRTHPIQHLLKNFNKSNLAICIIYNDVNILAFLPLKKKINYLLDKCIEINN